jgi:hypothetical protein
LSAKGEDGLEGVRKPAEICELLRLRRDREFDMSLFINNLSLYNALPEKAHFSTSLAAGLLDIPAKALAIGVPNLLFSSGLSDAGVAQLVEHLICNQRVGGSNPSASSTGNW